MNTLVLVALMSVSQIGTKNMDKERAAYRQCVSVTIPTIGTDTTTGTKGIINTIPITSLPQSVGETQIPTINQAGKIAFMIDDAVESGAVTCTGVEIHGQFGNGDDGYEYIATVSESETKTAYAWSRIDKIEVESCTNNAVNDHLVVYNSLDIYLGVNIRKLEDVKSFCIFFSDLDCAILDNGTIYDVESNIDLQASTIDTSVNLFGGVLDAVPDWPGSEKGTICSVVRPSF